MSEAGSPVIVRVRCNGKTKSFRIPNGPFYGCLHTMVELRGLVKIIKIEGNES